MQSRVVVLFVGSSDKTVWTVPRNSPGTRYRQVIILEMPASWAKEKDSMGGRVCHFELWHRVVSWDTCSLGSLKTAGVVLAKVTNVVIRETYYRMRIPAETPETHLTFTNECHPQI
jgi:hypothetical protein